MSTSEESRLDFVVREPVATTVNLMVVGEGAVGKSCLVHTFCDGVSSTSSQLHSATIGVTVRTCVSSVRESPVGVHFYDTTGSCRFREVVLRQLGRAHGLLLMFDLTQRESFDALPQWIRTLQEVGESIPVLLVGNKCDLPQRAKVGHDEATSLAKNHDLDLRLISTFSCDQVRQTVLELVDMVLKRRSTSSPVHSSGC